VGCFSLGKLVGDITKVTPEENLSIKIKKYWDNQPCNINHGKSRVGTKDYFDEVRNRRYFVEPHILKFADFSSWKNKKVLEIGCGIGTDACMFAKHGAQYTGIDISKESLQLAKEQFKLYEYKGDFFTYDASDNLDFQNFDLIYSYGVIHHHPNTERIINNVHSWLKGSGEFRFMVYARHSWKYAMIQAGLAQPEAQPNCPYVKYFTHQDIENMLGNRFTIEEIKQDHNFMYNLSDYNNDRYFLEPWFDVMDNDVREALRDYLGWHLLIKAKKC
jgi:SAM-dependent methyltransferase